MRLSIRPVIAIVDDDESLREALSDLVEVLGFSSRTFPGAEAFLTAYAPGVFDCLITDVRMPGLSGLQLQQRLSAMGCSIPIIFITASTDARTRSRVVEAGAIACLSKPIHEEELSHLLMGLRLRLGSGQGGQNP
jgi:two-component system response regulator FixJ